MTEKLDQTIERMCEWIQKELDKADHTEDNIIPEMTIALAQLVSARATHN